MDKNKFNPQQPLKKSQKFMVTAYVLVFIAQFFNFGTSSYFYSTHGGGFTLFNEAKVENNGWYYHPWYFGIVMGVVAYIFYTRYPKTAWYWAAAALCLILGFGGILGFISIMLAGYAVYIKVKKEKAV